MQWIDVTRQLLLYGHILAFALAIAEVFREDWRIFRASVLDLEGLAAAASRVKWLLVVLWATGLPLVGFDIGWDVAAIAAKPKLMMKLLVVVALTLNGALLHFVAFPLLSAPSGRLRLSAAVPSVLGAISSASWLYASFVGVARLVAPQMTFFMFLELYAAMVAAGVIVALLFIRPRLERLLAAQGLESPLFIEVEAALSAVGHAHDQLTKLKNSPFLRPAAELKRENLG